MYHHMTRLSKYETYIAITLEYVKIIMMLCAGLFGHIVVASYNISVHYTLVSYSNALLLMSIVLYKIYGSTYSDTIRRNKTALLAWIAFIAGFGLSIDQISKTLMFGYGLACSIGICGFYAGISDRYYYMKYDPYHTKIQIVLSFVSAFSVMLLSNIGLRIDTMVLIRFAYYIMIVVLYVFWCVDKFVDKQKADDIPIKKAVAYPLVRLVQRVWS